MGLLGRRLRELREHRGESLRDFAKRLDKSPGYISQIETRDEFPSPELLCQLAGIHDIDPAELFELARQDQLQQAEADIRQRQEAALALFRKAKRK